jgi:hypothetical protein
VFGSASPVACLAVPDAAVSLNDQSRLIFGEYSSNKQQGASGDHDQGPHFDNPRHNVSLSFRFLHGGVTLPPDNKDASPVRSLQDIPARAGFIQFFHQKQNLSRNEAPARTSVAVSAMHSGGVQR